MLFIIICYITQGFKVSTDTGTFSDFRRSDAIKIHSRSLTITLKKIQVLSPSPIETLRTILVDNGTDNLNKCIVCISSTKKHPPTFLLFSKLHAFRTGVGGC